MELQFSNTIIWRRVISPESKNSNREIRELFMHSEHIIKCVPWQSAVHILSVLYGAQREREKMGEGRISVKQWMEEN